MEHMLFSESSSEFDIRRKRLSKFGYDLMKFFFKNSGLCEVAVRNPAEPNLPRALRRLFRSDDGKWSFLPLIKLLPQLKEVCITDIDFEDMQKNSESYIECIGEWAQSAEERNVSGNSKIEFRSAMNDNFRKDDYIDALIEENKKRFQQRECPWTLKYDCERYHRIRSRSINYRPTVIVNGNMESTWFWTGDSKVSPSGDESQCIKSFELSLDAEPKLLDEFKVSNDDIAAFCTTVVSQVVGEDVLEKLSTNLLVEGIKHGKGSLIIAYRLAAADQMQMNKLLQHIEATNSSTNSVIFCSRQIPVNWNMIKEQMSLSKVLMENELRAKEKEQEKQRMCSEFENAAERASQMQSQWEYEKKLGMERRKREQMAFLVQKQTEKELRRTVAVMEKNLNKQRERNEKLTAAMAKMEEKRNEEHDKVRSELETERQTLKAKADRLENQEQRLQEEAERLRTERSRSSSYGAIESFESTAERMKQSEKELQQGMGEVMGGFNKIYSGISPRLKVGIQDIVKLQEPDVRQDIRCNIYRKLFPSDYDRSQEEATNDDREWNESDFVISTIKEKSQKLTEFVGSIDPSNMDKLGSQLLESEMAQRIAKLQEAEYRKDLRCNMYSKLFSEQFDRSQAEAKNENEEWNEYVFVKSLIGDKSEKLKEYIDLQGVKQTVFKVVKPSKVIEMMMSNEMGLDILKSIYAKSGYPEFGFQYFAEALIGPKRGDHEKIE